MLGLIVVIVLLLIYTLNGLYTLLQKKEHILIRIIGAALFLCGLIPLIIILIGLF